MDQEPVTSTPTRSFVPTSWPGAFGAFKFSRDAVMVNLSVILGLIGLTLLSAILFDFILSNDFLNQVVVNLVSVWLGAATTYTVLKSSVGNKVTFSEALSNGASYFLNYLLLSILTAVTLVLSILLFVIPFFFVLPRIVLAPYFLVDKNMGPVDAFKASWQATSGHSAKIWGIIGATILMALLIFVLVGIYLLVMYSAVFAILYFFLASHKSADGQVSPPAQAPLQQPAA